MTRVTVAGAVLELDDAALASLAEQVAPLIGDTGADRWLTAEEAAEHLRCPTSRIYSLSSADRIPKHRDGSRLLFRESELDAWVENGGGRRP